MCLYKMIYSQISYVVFFVLIFEEVLCNDAYNPLLDEDYENAHTDNSDSAEIIEKRRIKHEGHDEEHEYPRYKYGYSVHDPKTKDIKSAWEHRDGDVTHGEYSLVEPDGAIRIVRYVVTKKEGFRAVVDRIPPPHSSKGQKSSQSFGFGTEKSQGLSGFNDDKFQSYYSPPPQRNYDFTPAHYQMPNIKDFHQSSEKPFSPSHAEFQDISAELKNRNQNFQFSSQQKESEEEDENSEEEDGDEGGRDNEDQRGNNKYVAPLGDVPRYVAPAHQSEGPRYNFQNLQDVSHQYNLAPFENNEALPRTYQHFNPNQQRNQFDFSQIQAPFKPSQRDFSDTGFQDLGRPNPLVNYNPGNVNSGVYFPKPPPGKTASYQSITYNSPKEHSHTVIHTPSQHNNVPASPLQNMPPHEINTDMLKHLPYYEDTYYPPHNGNYKYSQPQVQSPHIGNVINSLNAPPAHSFPSTSHLLTPPQEKLPNYSENQNSQFNLPPPGTPISHNHHHEGEFDRYD